MDERNANKPAKGWPVETITIGPRKRPIDDAAVVQLMKSMEHFGQLHPITLRIGDAKIDGDGYLRPMSAEVDGHVIKDVPILVAGQQRLEAARRLGWFMIDAISVGQCDELEAEMIEISENPDRAELTVAERAAQIVQWMKLCELRKQQDKPGQLDQVSSVPEMKPSTQGGRGKEGGVAAASRELGPGTVLRSAVR